MSEVWLRKTSNRALYRAACLVSSVSEMLV